MKLKIVSDGTRQGTTLQDEHGNVVKDVSLLSWEMDAEYNTATARVELCELPCEIVGEVTDVAVPHAAVALLGKALEGLDEEQFTQVAEVVETQRLRRIAKFVSAPFKVPDGK